MYNFIDAISADPGHYRQLHCAGQLMAEFNCPLDLKQQDLWSHGNYFVYVLNGRKDWCSADGMVALHQGEMAFVRKGGSIVVQHFEAPFCLLLFFMSDEFICETFRMLEREVPASDAPVPALMRMHVTPVLKGFFQSMLPHFAGPAPDSRVLELKFRELLLNLASDPRNTAFVASFRALMSGSVQDRLRRTMEDNYCFNLSLEDYARLCGRSLSAFKRDFQEVFGTAPGRWLRVKRLERARLLLAAGGLQVSEVAFQCGFENLSHFSRAFKEVYGHPPAALRQAKA